MNIKKGDTVQIMVGKDRGKRSKVIRSIPKQGKVLVEGMNLAKRHSRPKTAGAKGEIVSVAKPIPCANVRIVCSACGKGVRIRIRRDAGRAERRCANCDSVIS